MEGLGVLFGLVSVVGGLILFLTFLSIAIDCARLLRRANRLIEIQDQQTRFLAAISANIAKAPRRDPPRPA